MDLEHLNFRVTHPTLEDAFGHSIQGDYYQGYEAALQYAYDVLTNKIITGQQCKNAILRFVNDLDRDDLELRNDTVNMVILVANSLKHVKGAIADTPMFLLPWMILVITNIFGFYYTTGVRDGTRRFQKAYIMVGRGNAKSTLLSAITVYTLLFNKNGAPYACSAARNMKQARICFDDCRKMLMKAAPAIRNKFEVQMHKIICPSTGGLFEAVSSDAEGLDGKRISGIGILDELHAHPDATVYNAIKTGITASADPLLFAISTAGKYSIASVAMLQQEHGRAVNTGVIDDDRYYYIEYSTDDDDAWDDETTWIKGNPSLGHSVNHETLKSERDSSRHNAIQRADFITKYCNRFYSTSSASYLDIMEFKKGASTSLTLECLKGREAYLGLDLAAHSDLCSLAVALPTDNGGIDIYTKNYLPEGQLSRVSPSLAQKYKSMQGEHLTLTAGEVTDHEYIKQDILHLIKHLNVKSIAYDANAGGYQFAIQMLKDHNVEMVDVKQGFGLSEPAKVLEALVKSEKIKYKHNDAVIEWCVSNAVYTEGQLQDIKVHKPKQQSYSKVDTVIALLTAMKMVVLREQNISIYENRGIFTLD